MLKRFPPPNATRLLGLIAAGTPPPDPIIVSFVGSTGLRNLHLFPDPAKHYDWSCTKGLAVHIYTRPGIDIRDALASIFAVYEEPPFSAQACCPAVVDVDDQEVFFLVRGNPIETWPVRKGTKTWRGFFPL